jgi:hypothetical protein
VAVTHRSGSFIAESLATFPTKKEKASSARAEKAFSDPVSCGLAG